MGRVNEEELELRAEGESPVPVSVWSADGAPRGAVLLGHGLCADRTHPTVRIPAEQLVERGLAVVAPDLPGHGVRRGQARDPDQIAEAWQSYWSSGGPAALRDEWVRILAFTRQRFPNARVGYFGLSLAAQYGVVFLANAPQVAAAVLGLWGAEPAPKSAILHACAPRVRCPVYFVQKQSDELHPRERSDHLFSLLGSAAKVMHSTPGRHADVTPEEYARACGFLAEQL
jgi:dienelactone hydrolase